MSFSGQSNPPWQRNNLNNVIQGQLGNSSVGQLGSSGMGFHQGTSSQMFMQQSQQNMGYNHGSMQSGSGGGSGGGGGGSGMYQQGGGSSSISYPPVRTSLNPAAFQNNSHGGSMHGQSHNRGQQQPQHYNAIGTITKINSDCGLVNEEVFFYRNVCKGYNPRLGDRVLFESTFNPNGQFKWNATRVQLMPQSGGMNSNQATPLMGSAKKGGGGGGGGSGYNAVPPPNEYQHLRAQQQRKPSPRRGSPGGRDRGQRSDRDRRDRERSPRRRDMDDEENDRKRRREDHGRSKERNRGGPNRNDMRDRDRERDRDRDDTKREQDQIIMDRRKALTEREREREREQREREREREKDRDRSPIHRGKSRIARRAIRRYMVQIPKISLTITSADVQGLRERYSTLYIPSDFFHADIKWPHSFTPANPFSLCRPCKFHIKNKNVEPLGGVDPHAAELLEPEDADYLYSAKVMLLSLPPIAELYSKCFEAEDENENDQHSMHPSRLISFLVGTRGRNEPMAIGGPWSPSMDGENPDKDPTVLVRTAIRTCKALTGIDLSNCTQWYRFLELYYHRSDHKSKDQDVPARIETVVIYLPDVHSCVPTVSEWEQLSQGYKAAVENMFSSKADNSKQTSATASSGADDNGNATLANDFNNTSAADADTDAAAADAADAEMEEVDAKSNNQQTEVPPPTPSNDDAAEDQNEEDKGPQPTHYSQLDLKNMKVQEIRNELNARNLPSRGLRNMLMARLAKALNTEKEEEEANNGNDVNEAVEEIDEIINCDSDSENKAADDAGDDGNAENDAQNEEPQEEAAEEAAATAEGEEQEAEDEQDDWANVDMNDIVILDEYDSSKNPEEQPKELDEKEKSHLIRRYTLPSTPQVIVHPSRIAKGGKFDCTLMSLSVLLDYRPDDTKERFFEVSLFAELFNEMLMRDFGFNIYKALYLHKEGTLSEANDNDASNNKDENKSNEDEEKSSTKDNKNGEHSTDEKQKSKERRISKVSLGDMDATNEDDSQSIKSSADRKRRGNEKSAVDKKSFIVRPQLLLSFVYFDTTLCGYIFEKDLEDLFSILGLNLSRSQIRKVLGKSASRQAIYYRKLTDKEDLIDAPPTIEEHDEITAEELNLIAMGNKQFYPKFKSDEEKSESTNKDATFDDQSGLANYNGAVIHVGKLVEQIKRTETSYADLEKLYTDILKQYTDLQKEHSKSSSKIKDLQSEVKSLNRKISDTDQDLYTVNRKYKDQNATLSYIYHRVAPYFNREKDKDHKSESSRDKDEKHKDKDDEKASKDKTPKEDEKDNTNTEQDKKEEDEKEKPQSDSNADAAEEKDDKNKKAETKKAKVAEIKIKTEEKTEKK